MKKGWAVLLETLFETKSTPEVAFPDCIKTICISLQLNSKKFFIFVGQ